MAGHSLFYQLAILLLLAGSAGFIAFKLRQPLILAFIAVGLLAGPDALNLIDNKEPAIETLAGLGISLLLFMVGLKLDVGLIRKLGPAALVAGLAQVGLTAALGAGAGLLLGFDFRTAVFLGIALSFSSTIIVIKLLSDRHDIDSLHGKLSLGILIVQDFAVIACMLVLSALAARGGHLQGISGIPAVLAKLSGILLFTTLFIRYAARPLTAALSRSPELLVIVALGLAAATAGVCQYAGLGRELGGLLAGISLASTPYHNVIAARLSGVRDFLMLFFFVGLGLQINIGALDAHTMPALVLLLFVLVGKPLITMAILGFLGYRARTSFMTGLTLGQISEFSLIFIAMAASAHLVDAGIFSLVSLVGLASIAISTYLIESMGRLYLPLERKLSLFERKKTFGAGERALEAAAAKIGPCDVIIFGLGRYGHAMARQFIDKGVCVLGVDFDPDVVRAAQSRGIPALYGDAADPDLPANLPLAEAKAIVFAFYHHMTGPLIADLRFTLAEILRERGYKGHIAVTSHYQEDEAELIREGVDIILRPFLGAARHGADQIMDIISAEP